MDVHLIDGTYELFRYFYALPSARDREGREVGAVRGVIGSVLGLINRGATHVGVATDHVIESFRNRMWRGYKTGAGIDPELLSQFGLLEEALTALGVVVWAMVEEEADDALAAAARIAGDDPAVEKVLICTPDKDLAQCVRGTRVVQWHRRTNKIVDEAGVVSKFGVRPASIPDYLALVGDSADGYPGLTGWGAKSAAAVLAKFEHLEASPDDPGTWHVNAANSGPLTLLPGIAAGDGATQGCRVAAGDAGARPCRTSSLTIHSRLDGAAPRFDPPGSACRQESLLESPADGSGSDRREARAASTSTR